MNAREEWLAGRRKGLGGSDAAAALGQSRHVTAFQLYQEKLGLIPDDMVVSPEAAERMEFGQLIEQVIADMYAKRYGVKLRRHNKLAQHARFPYMLASYDRTIDGRHEGVECKNVDALSYRFGEWGEEHSDQVPQEYLLQCHHYLATSGYDVWHLAACVGGNSLKVYHIERDPEMIDLVEQGEAEFWEHVERRDPPPLDYRHRSAIPLLKKMYPGSNGETVKLPFEAETMHYARLQFEDDAALMETGAKAAKARILHMMGEASVGLLPNGGGYTRKLVKRDGYTVEPTTYIDFRFSARKGEK
ncbi:YqaJ viral recombinase family nuclease [Paraburkholderia adhaesiva]|uniref:YqaJ viral recombinase family nuclease n=1 Tax=Paraburkholderia adhaesiva TaxID=2883244 RepID=UPI001F3990CB|nr:YqaJ viral recombinase family protein [Paraburkholderia adhaesiva]